MKNLCNWLSRKQHVTKITSWRNGATSLYHDWSNREQRYTFSSCLNCEYCDQGQELYYEQRQFYGFDEFDQGSFATYATWNEHFLFRIPESIPSAEAAPLMCAGAVYSALRSAGVQWHHRVGVLGLGGLGHLAVQYAAKMGCHVTAYSHSSGKEEAARNLGALDF